MPKDHPRVGRTSSTIFSFLLYTLKIVSCYSSVKIGELLVRSVSPSTESHRSRLLIVLGTSWYLQLSAKLMAEVVKYDL